jgi:toxin ParE1/3/4
MAGKPVRFHLEAEREYLSSLSWYHERSPSAALDFEDEFRKAISAISESPDRWPIYLSRCHRYILHQFPFSLVYRILDDEVFILAVAHGHRRPGYWRKRLRQ